MKIFARASTPPWYAGGLAFECGQCGRCCAGPEEGYVWASEDEIADIAAHLGIAEAEMYRRYVRKVDRRFTIIERPDNHDCVFLGYLDGNGGCASSNAGTGATGGAGSSAGGCAAAGRGCLVYPVRPTQCRTWPFWHTNLTDPDAWAHAGTRCRGINCGPLVPLDEIERRRRATRV
jgi:uncharacterized protein